MMEFLQLISFYRSNESISDLDCQFFLSVPTFSHGCFFSFVSFHEILKHFIHLRQKTARVVLDSVISFVNSGTDCFEVTLKKVH